MIQAVWRGVVLAEAVTTRRIEGNHYFPADSLYRQYFTVSATRTLCPWKGIAHYYDVTVGGVSNPDAAWYYPHPLPIARILRLKNHVAFWNSVKIRRIGDDQANAGER